MRVCKIVVLMLLLPVTVWSADESPPTGWKEVSGGYKKQAYKVWLPTEGKFDDTASSIVSPKFGQIRIY